MAEDQRESIMKMQKEYLEYKNSFGGLIPNRFLYKLLGTYGEWVLLAQLMIYLYMCLIKYSQAGLQSNRTC